MPSENLKKNKVKVCHLSSVHFALDTRIFFRFCQTLSNQYDVTLIAVHPVKEIKNGILIIPFKRFHNRKIRVAIGWFLMFFKAIRVNALIYQIHDPELIPCGMLLKLFGKQVILDIHENIAEDIFDKPWIKNQERIYKIFTWFERPACRNFRIMLAENSYEKRYHLLAGTENCTTVKNFCNYNFFKPYVNSGNRNLTNLFYIGIVLENRGILEIAKAVYLQKQIGRNVIFHCVGELYSDLDHKLKSLPFYSEISNQLVFHGRLPLDEGYALSVNMGIGLCIIHPMKNSIESYPTKLFEYMASGLPVIISDFDLYKSVVETSGCGICVDPLNPLAISNAITYLNEHPEEALKMGMKGRIAAEEFYNWDQEKVRLLSLYEELST